MSWFLAGSLLSLLVAAHPFTTYPASLALLGWLRPRPIRPDAGTTPQARRFMICVCAYNEERDIAAKAQNLRDILAQYPNGTASIYIDASSDRTADILIAEAPEIPVVIAIQRRGKTHGMNLLAARGDAEILIFTDANVRVDPDAIGALLSRFDDPSIGLAAGHLSYINPSETVTARSGAAYWRLDERTKALETRCGSMMGADGSLFAMRRSLHRPVPDDLIDDLTLSLDVLCQGYRAVRVDEARCYERTATKLGDEYRRKVRISCQAVNVYRHFGRRLLSLSPLDLYKFASHRLLRTAMPFSLLLGTLCAIAAMAESWGLATAALSLTGVAFLIAIGVIAGSRAAHQLIDILSALAGVGVGVCRALRGDRFQTWLPAKSIRES